MSYFYIAASQAYLRKHNTSTDVVLLLVHRLRRWPNIETTLGEYLVFVATCSIGHYLNISNFVRNDTTHRNRVPS